MINFRTKRIALDITNQNFVMSSKVETRRRIQKMMFLVVPILALVLFGLLSYLYLLAPESTRESLLINETFVVGKNQLVFYKIELAVGEKVSGNLKETQKLCVDFYILNESNFAKINAKSEDISPFLAAKKVSSYDFTFTAPSKGVYYFVFDNGYTREDPICYDKHVTFRLCRA